MTIRSNYSPSVINQARQVANTRLFSAPASSSPTQIFTSTQDPFFLRCLKQISSLIRPLSKVLSAQAEPRHRVNFFESWEKMHPKESILQAYLNRLKINWMSPDCSATIIQDFKAYCLKHVEGERFVLQKYIAYNLIALSHLQQYDNAPALVKIIDSSLDTDKQHSFFRERLAQLNVKMRQDAQWKTADLVKLERLITDLCDPRIKNTSCLIQ